MKFIPLTIALTILLAQPLPAHFIWLELPPEPGAIVHLRFAEAPREHTSAKLLRLAAPMAVSTANGKTIDFQAVEGKAIAPLDVTDSLVVGNLEYGVMDRDGDVFLLHYHAKGAGSRKSAGQATDLAVDIRAEIIDGTLTATVYFRGEPVEAAELVVDLPNATSQQKTITDNSGQASFAINGEGWLGIRAMVPEKQAGSHKEERYEQIRHYSTLTLHLPSR